MPLWKIIDFLSEFNLWMAENIPEKCQGSSDIALFIQCYVHLAYQDQTEEFHVNFW